VHRYLKTFAAESCKQVPLTRIIHKVEIIYMSLQQIYSGNGTPNFTRIDRILYEILQKNFWSHFSGHTM